ncbi:MAG: hypothetical protein QOI38_1516 [Sphingomonadales bacterium]|jgi:hypothetical protein|nr:hypothetical protein [Sphingomonadales bacterium]
MLSVHANRRLALAIGFVLPLAETVRRSADLASWWLWIDDWLIGAALIAGAWAAGSGRAGGLRALAAAWGFAAGLGYYSLVGHLLRTGEADVSGLPGWTVMAAIGIGWLVTLYALASTLLAEAR